LLFPRPSFATNGFNQDFQLANFEALRDQRLFPGRSLVVEVEIESGAETDTGLPISRW
jgi:hypothetical protein